MKTKILALFLLAGSCVFAGPRVFFGVGFGGGYGYYAPPPPVPMPIATQLLPMRRPAMAIPGFLVITIPLAPLLLARWLLGLSALSWSVLVWSSLLRWPLLSRLLAPVTRRTLQRRIVFPRGHFIERNGLRLRITLLGQFDAPVHAWPLNRVSCWLRKPGQIFLGKAHFAYPHTG